MGRGDKKTAKGKRKQGSFGVSRNKSKIKTRLKRVASKKVVAAGAEAKPKKTARKKAQA